MSAWSGSTATIRRPDLRQTTANEVLIGFDSAWTDSARRPGAISAMSCIDGQDRFHPPRLATFGQALAFVDEVARGADCLLIGIDQPTIVNNERGSRPVDRVAASVVSRLKGGVQPARRGGTAASMFGDAAPIWPFLDALGAIQNPIEARGAMSGRYAMEVFPALALPAMVPEIWQRRRAAKYNPAATRYVASDWGLVAHGTARFARALRASALADWLDEHAMFATPRKAEQDCMDAAICLAITLAWRHGPVQATMQIGDERDGFIAAIVSAETRPILEAAAAKQGAAVDAAWVGRGAALA